MICQSLLGHPLRRGPARRQRQRIDRRRALLDHPLGQFVEEIGTLKVKLCVSTVLLKGKEQLQPAILHSPVGGPPWNSRPINPWARPKQGLADGHIHLPGDRDIERRGATICRRIDLLIDGLSNVRKPATRGLTFVAVDRRRFPAGKQPPTSINWRVRRTVLGGSADRAVLVSREGPFVAPYRRPGSRAGAPSSRPRFPGSANLDAAARAVPVDGLLHAQY